MRPDTLVIYAVQFFYGGWFVFHGLNYWLHFFVQPPGASGMAKEFIGALIHSGLFDWVKAIEVLVGVALLANRFVPLAAVAAFPITIVIAYLNLAIEGDLFGVVVGVVIIALNGIIALGRLDRFRPMLAFDAGDPAVPSLTPGGSAAREFAGRSAAE